ncbi:helix-turn-helix domain-containing protein [Candidatus Albibeggiatoa sp. nov. BB20]|uniref:helix-turn-helix domain-containing protein n=1 Tax=Candidatus Albibeggiatoa sp. nov. BB20 TaxID=3162723 RepID=UPI0033658D11
MSDFFKSISQGMKEAIDYSQNQCPQAIIHEFSATDVKNIRDQTGMSQNEFASTFGISVSTLQHWERGKRCPQGAALVLLNLIKKKLNCFLNYKRINNISSP